MLQTMSDTPVIGRQSRSVPLFGRITPASYGPSGVPSLKWLRAVSQIRHVNASPVVQFRVTVRSGGHVKKRIRSRESDIYLICTQRAPVIDTSNYKDSFGRGVEHFPPQNWFTCDQKSSRWIVLWLLLFSELPLSYWWMPWLSASMPNLTRSSVEIQSLKYDW